MNLKKSILNIHLVAVCFLFLNFILYIETDYSINYYIKIILKGILILTGASLIFLYKKKTVLLYLYSIIYMFFSILVILNYSFFKRFDILNILNERNYNENGLALYRQFTYYKLECCYFLVYKKEYFLFEKKLGYINTAEKISNDTHELKLVGSEIVIKSDGTYYNESKDSIENADLILHYQITQDPF